MSDSLLPVRRTRKERFVLVLKWGLVVLFCYLLWYLNHSGFDWRRLRYHTDQEYITAAEPKLKELFDDYPVTAQQRKEMNFKIYVGDISLWQGYGDGPEESFLSRETRSGGRYVYILFTPPPECWQYRVEVYMSYDLRKVVKTYSDFSGPAMSELHTKDRDCPRKSQ